MANKIVTEGDPDKLVQLVVKVPLWLKVQASKKAATQLQDLSEWLRGLILREVGGAGPAGDVDAK